MQTGPDEKRLPPNKIHELGDLRVGRERRSIACVQFLYLFDREILQRDVDADIEGGLIEIGYEKMRFGGVRNGHGQASPWGIGFERPKVMPGPNKPEYFGPEIATEKSIHPVERPKEVPIDLCQEFPGEKSFESRVGTSPGIPPVGR